MYYNSTIALHWDINTSQENSTLMKAGEPNGDLKVSAEQKKVGAGSAYFDGAGDYLKFPAIDEYKKMQNFSVGCWVNYSNSGSLVVITRQANPDANGDWQLVLVGGTSTVQFYYRGNTGGDAANANYVNAGIFANDATWHLIGFTCNITSNIMYCYNIFNGTSSQASLSVNSNEPLDNPSAIYIGSNSQNPGTQVYQGGMDECFVINKSFTWGKDSDWEHIYNNGTGRLLVQEPQLLVADEASGDAAIGAGVQNALLSGYTNYTTQQIHSRNLSNSQSRGTFDWMAKKGNKVWAFNYVTKGEQHVNMLNLTPTLYVLEMSNITTSNITKAVEFVINATK